MSMLGILPRLAVIGSSGTTAGAITRLFTCVTTLFGNPVRTIFKGGGDFGVGLFLSLLQSSVLSPTLLGRAICFLLLYRSNYG